MTTAEEKNIRNSEILIVLIKMIFTESCRRTIAELIFLFLVHKVGNFRIVGEHRISFLASLILTNLVGIRGNRSLPKLTVF